MNWSTRELLTADGTFAQLSQVASDRQGNMVAVFQQVVPGHDFYSTYSTSLALTRTRDASTGRWSDTKSLLNDEFGGSPIRTDFGSFD